MGQVDEEQRMLESKLNKALEEAWAKTNAALEDTASAVEGSTRKIWLAAEATEYSSLLYSLTYGLEDVDPPLAEKKSQDALSLVKESISGLRQVRETGRLTHLQAYELLRDAAQGLRTAYLNTLKNSEKPR